MKLEIKYNNDNRNKIIKLFVRLSCRAMRLSRTGCSCRQRDANTLAATLSNRINLVTFITALWTAFFADGLAFGSSWCSFLYIRLFVTRKSCLRRNFLVTKSSTKATYVTVVTKKSCLRRDFLVTKQLLREKQLLRSYIYNSLLAS